MHVTIYNTNSDSKYLKKTDPLPRLGSRSEGDNSVLILNNPQRRYKINFKSVVRIAGSNPLWAEKSVMIVVTWQVEIRGTVPRDELQCVCGWVCVCVCLYSSLSYSCTHTHTHIHTHPNFPTQQYTYISNMTLSTTLLIIKDLTSGKIWRSFDYLYDRCLETFYFKRDTVKCYHKYTEAFA
jgi:hypothetical protein